jgi:predicted nucleotidyltransferase
MDKIEHIKMLLAERLKPLDPEKVILFGSYAYGTPNSESDIDLYVVTKDDFLPKNYEESNEVYMRISRKIRDIKEEFPIDLIVHTRKMYEKFIQRNSSFSREILGKGIALYES